MTAITISIWHNVHTDPHGHHLAMLDGYTPGDPMVRVFTYQTRPRGRTPEQIAEDTFAAYAGVDLVRARVVTHGAHEVAGCVH